MMQISYCLHVSGNYHVTLRGADQTISVCLGYFSNLMGIKGNVEVGCREIDVKLAKEIGFLL